MIRFTLMPRFHNIVTKSTKSCQRLSIPPRYQKPVFPGCQLHFDDYNVRCNSFNCFNLFINNSVFIFLNGFICPSRNQRKRNFTAIYICINFNFDFFTIKSFKKRDIQFEGFRKIGIYNLRIVICFVSIFFFTTVSYTHLTLLTKAYVYVLVVLY
ncbi:hypothetical protein PG1821B_1603 [Bifidobacterium animalis subsp. lactis]|nr:hypothetical protein PG1821B_1603 [Bifidobacterium animalis subsp. lactis]